MKKTLEWIANSHMFFGFTLVSLIFVAIFVVVTFTMVLVSFAIQDWSCVSTFLLGCLEYWRTIVAIYIGFSCLFSFGSFIEDYL